MFWYVRPGMCPLHTCDLKWTDVIITRQFLRRTYFNFRWLTPIRSWTKNSGDGRRGPSSCATNMKNTQLRAKDPKLIVQNFSASCGWYPYTLRSMWFVIATNYFIRSTNTALPSKCTMVPIFPFVNKLVFVTGVGLLDTLFPHRCALRVGHQMSNVSMLSYFKKNSKHHSNETIIEYADLSHAFLPSSAFAN